MTIGSANAARSPNLCRRLRRFALGLRDGRHAPRLRRLHAARAGDVDESRVIRTIAGLRPYRRSGFVSARERSAKGAGPQLRPWRRRHHLELGHVEAGDRARAPGPQRAGRGDRLGRDGPVDRAAGAGSRFSGDDLRRGASARDHVEHRRRSVPSLMPCSAKARSTPEFMAQFTRALDYSWRRFQIMVGDDYGIRWLPTYVETDSPEAKSSRPSRR